MQCFVSNSMVLTKMNAVFGFNSNQFAAVDDTHYSHHQNKIRRKKLFLLLNHNNY